MDAPIGGEQCLVTALCGDRLELADEQLRLEVILVAGPLGCQPRGPRFEADADLVDSGEVGDADLGDEASAAGKGRDVPLASEPLDGFADWRSTDAEPL